ncbi:hypothetical protein BLS_001187 [Venturia inaequalis]|uniref:Uncharacterized protein n=2 Tax=Venturia inaequalis TaxID=5025 RepID=A0A8H3YIN7_VENIN|nr:hypothetical protein BLS_001187 [Venturia inaequalis]KAE9967504.1 hypothetical protein EG328_008155 [Venturia inaequalis]RDI80120.1 hypothetical protein Vi05172_g9816 [Venturia inaequalis]
MCISRQIILEGCGNKTNHDRTNTLPNLDTHGLPARFPNWQPCPDVQNGAVHPQMCRLPIQYISLRTTCQRCNYQIEEAHQTTVVRSGRVFAVIPNAPVIQSMNDLNMKVAAGLPDAVAAPNLYQRRTSSKGEIATHIQLNLGDLDRRQHRNALNRVNATETPKRLDRFEFGSLNAFTQARNSRNAAENSFSNEKVNEMIASAFRGEQEGNGFRFNDEQLDRLMEDDTFAARDLVVGGTKVSGAGAFGQGNEEGGEEGGFGGLLDGYRPAAFFPEG